MRDGPPVGMQLDRRDREDEKAEAAVAEDPLDPVERDRPDDERDDDDRDRISQRYGSPESSRRQIARPPISAASVIRFTI